MKLCSGYFRNKNKSLINVIGDFDETYVIIYIAGGSNQEKLGKRGINHISEHILLKEIESEYLNYCRDDNFDYKGHTDYTNVILEFNIDKPEHIDIFFYAFDKVKKKIIYKNIDQRIIEISKKEVLEECREKNYSNEQINIFLSQGEVSWLPIGKTEDIYDFSNQIIIDCLQNYFTRMNIIVLSKSKIREYNICDSQIMVNPNVDSQGIDGTFYKTKMPVNGTDIYVKLYKNKCDEDFITENIFEHILINRISKYRKLNFQLCLQGKIQMENLCILEKEICLNEFELAKKNIQDTIYNMKDINSAYIISNLLNHFNYGDSLLLTCKCQDKLLRVLRWLDFSLFKRHLSVIYANGIFVIN